MIFKIFRGINFNFAKLVSITCESFSSDTTVPGISVKDYDAAIKKLRVRDLVCPKCGKKGCMIRYGHYKRNYIIHGTKKEKISIQRVYCKDCKYTHAILPEEIVPYSQYSIYFIVMVLALYAARAAGVTVEKICETADIAQKQLYRWVRIFNKHKEAFLTAVVSNSISLDKALKGILAYTSYADDLANPVLKKIHRIPMQNHRNPTHTNRFEFQ